MKKFRLLFTALLLIQLGTGPFTPAAPVRAVPSAGDYIGRMRIPSHLASTMSIHTPAHASRFVCHIQDLHEQVEPQINLAEVVSLMEKEAGRNGKILVVAVEGASGEIDTNSITQLPDPRSKQAVVAGLLQAGYLYGEEYAALTHDPGRIKLVGIENSELYARNVIVKENSAILRERALRSVGEIKKQLKTLIDHNFNPTLAEMEKNRLKLEEDAISIADHVRFLNEVHPSLTHSYPALVGVLEIKRMEQNVDFDRVDKDRRELIEEITKGQSPAEKDAMLKAAIDFREGRMSALAYYSSLMKEAARPHPSVEFYLSYLMKAEKINTDEVYEEINQLERRIAKIYLKHPVAETLYENLRWAETTERFLSLNMLPQEWDKQRSTDPEMTVRRFREVQEFVSEQVDALGYRFSAVRVDDNDLKAAAFGAREFYRLAEARNAAFMENLKTVMAQYPAEKADFILIAGGFHTPGLTQLMRSNNMAYAVMRPQARSSVVLPEGIKYPLYGTARETPYFSSVNYLRAQLALATSQGREFIADLMRRPGHQLPASGWLEKFGSEKRTSDKIRVRESFAWVWRWVTAAIPPLKFFETAAAAPENSYVSVAVDALTRTVGGNEREFSMGLNRILASRPVSSTGDPAYVAIDVDSPMFRGFGGQRNQWVSLFAALNERTSGLFSTKAHVVFFSREDKSLAEFAPVSELANKRMKEIRFSSVRMIGGNDMRAVMVSAGIPESQLVGKRIFVLSAEDRGYDQAEMVLTRGLPHLALAAFACTHYKDAGSVLEQLASLLERLTPLRMNGSLSDRILADVLAKISA